MEGEEKVEEEGRNQRFVPPPQAQLARVKSKTREVFFMKSKFTESIDSSLFLGFLYQENLC